ncbi:MAG: hypothetical protein ACLFP2_02260 [Candidatus Woesearchaeota archaeon]
MKRLMFLSVILVLLITGCDKPVSNVADTTESSDIKVKLLDSDGNAMNGSNRFLTVSIWNPKTNEGYSKDVNESGEAEFYEEPGEYVVYAEAPGQSFFAKDMSLNLVDGVQFKRVRFGEDKEITLEYNGKVWNRYEEKFEEPNVIATVVDNDGNPLPAKRVYFGSKSTHREAIDSDWDKRAYRIYTTNHLGVVKAKLPADQYVVGLDNVQSYYLSDIKKVPANGNYTIIEFSDTFDGEIAFGDTTRLEKEQTSLHEEEIAGEQRAAEEEVEQKLAEREEYCKEYPMTRCCMKDFYRVVGNETIYTRSGLETLTPETVYGYDIDVGARVVDKKWLHLIGVEGELIGNATEDFHTYGLLLMEIVGCGYPEAGEPECCMHITSAMEGQLPYSIGQERDGLRLEDADTMTTGDSSYGLDDAFAYKDKIYFKNRTVRDYKGEKILGVVMDSLELDSNEYFMREGDTRTLFNHTATLVSVDNGDAVVSVLFNQTTEELRVDSPVDVNGLRVGVAETFKDSAIVSLG